MSISGRQKTFFKNIFVVITFLFPVLTEALEKVSLPPKFFHSLCYASVASPQKCSQVTFYSAKHKLYFVFFAGYTGKNTGKSYDPSDFDHVSIFQNKLEKNFLSFYLEPGSSQISQMLNREFHPAVPDDKMNYFSAITVTHKHVLAGYHLNKKNYISGVHFHMNKGIRFRPINDQYRDLQPQFLNITPPAPLAMPFDLSKISVEAQNLPSGKLSDEKVKQIANGFLFRTIENQFYYIKETADGIYLAAFVDGKNVINCKFTNNTVISQLSKQGRFIQMFSEFKPFGCKIYFHSPDHAHPLFINVRNDDCTREVFTVNSIKAEGLSIEKLITIAEKELVKVYGKRVLKQRPWKITRSDEKSITLTGTFHVQGVGGVAEITLQKSNGKVLRMIHGK